MYKLGQWERENIGRVGGLVSGRSQTKTAGGAEEHGCDASTTPSPKRESPKSAKSPMLKWSALEEVIGVANEDPVFYEGEPDGRISPNAPAPPRVAVEVRESGAQVQTSGAMVRRAAALTPTCPAVLVCTVAHPSAARERAFCRRRRHPR